MPTFYWTAFAFVRFTLALMAGIVGASRIWPDFAGWPAIFGIALGIYLLAWLGLPKEFRRIYRTAFGAFALSTIALGGAALTHAHTERHYPRDLSLLTDTVRYYRAKIVTDPREKPRTFSATVAVNEIYNGISWQPARGRVVLYLAKADSGQQRPRYGDVLLLAGSPQPVAPPMNPHAFDYRSYLANQQVYHQQYVRPAQVKWLGHDPDWQVMAWSIAAKDWCNAQLRQYVASPAEAGIASALVLGVKDGLDNEITEAYTATGTMHVLAVSGMHVGLIFLLFAWLFDRFPAKSRPKIVIAVVSLVFLWAYAFVTGLSASVLRAVVMFTIMILAQTWGKNTNKYNNLAISAFLLLIFEPFMLWDVGFQLSYLAVLGILYLYGRIYRWLTVPTRVGDWIWQAVALSLAAQLATFPLSLYYFHQFPNYFLLANPPIIFLGTVGLWLGIALLGFSWLPYLGALLGSLLKWTIVLLNQVAGWIEALPGALWDGLHLSAPEMWLLYAMIGCLLALFHTANLAWLRAGLACALVFSAWQLIDYQQQARHRAFSIYHTNRQTNLAFRSARAGVLLADSALLLDRQQLKFNIENDLVQAGLSLGGIHFASGGSPVPDVLAVAEGTGYRLLIRHGKKILVLSRRPAFAQLPACDFLVISQNAVRRLAQLNGLQFKQLVVDASCSRYVAQQLATEAQAAGIACHAVPLAGAFGADLSSSQLK